MENRLRYLLPILLAVSLIFTYAACNKQPYIADFSNVKGYVIGRETCNTNEANDYWLIDLTYKPNTPQYGDTLALNGTSYTNVIKAKNLDARLKETGMKVSIDFKVITPDKVETTGCGVANPVTYSLKELFIINQGEIR